MFFRIRNHKASIQPGASSGIHTSNQTLELHRTGKTASDIRRTLEIFAEYLPKDIASEAMPKARFAYARQFLSAALSHLRVGNHSVANQFVLEAVSLTRDAPALPEFAQLIQDAAAGKIRQEISGALLRSLQSE
jgi:hypothetical protein